ncbi:N-acyl homoserine lactonase family protein [bacterium]|nr:N-acyl homoserine lactonase family protein [bacterium]
MGDWKISTLYFGEGVTIKDMLTSNLDVGMELVIPYLGFLVQDGETNLLFDTGINDNFFIDGKAWAGRPSVGGETYVVKSLGKKGLKPEDIDIVIYSHLHNDHAGNCHLFPHAQHVFQKDEWANFIDPLPSQLIRRDFDLSVIPVLKKFDCLKVDGDLPFRPGLTFFKTPGHTAGSQSMQVRTALGNYLLIGDTAPFYCNLYPKTDEIISMKGEKIKITPAPDVYGPAIPSSIIYDHYAWYDSIYKIKALITAPQYVIPGHDPSLVGKTFG